MGGEKEPLRRCAPPRDEMNPIASGSTPRAKAARGGPIPGGDGRPQRRPAAARKALCAFIFFHGLKSPFDSPAAAGSLRTGYGFYRRPAAEGWGADVDSQLSHRR